MIYDLPINLNGFELRDELRKSGINISDERSAVAVDENGKLFLDIDEKFDEKAKVVVAKHNGTVVAKELTINQKLASVGLSIDDLKLALGL